MPLLRLLLLILLLPTILAGQASECGGDTFTRFNRDPAGVDFRVSCLIDYDGGQLAGGMIGNRVVLWSTTAAGGTRWKSSFLTESESSELTTLNALLLDGDGMIAGTGSTFTDDNQRGYLFRYDPAADRLLYFRWLEERSEPGGLLETGAGDYLMIATRLGLPPPLFTRAFTQRFDRVSGITSGEANYYDLDGDERFNDFIPHPDGGYLVAGQQVQGGGSGAVRASLTYLDDEMRVRYNQIGPIRADTNARLLANDVEVLDGRIYLLQWGDIGVITGSVNTSPILTCFTLSGTALWTKRYDLAEYSGEAGYELAVQDDHLLIYGFTLDGDRDPFLLSVDPDGSVRWAKGYPLAGRVLLYQRANQQLAVTPLGPRFVATVTHAGSRPHEGLMMQVDELGGALSPCFTPRELNVAVSSPGNDWRRIALRQEVGAMSWTAFSSRSAAPNWEVYDACDTPCPDCSGRRVERMVRCPGDSVLIAGSYRRESGIYDLGVTRYPGGCDTARLIDLRFTEPVGASYRQAYDCSATTSGVQITATGGQAPYTYAWSQDSIRGDAPTLSFGNYTVTVTDDLGCSSPPLSVPIDRGAGELQIQVTAPSCPGAGDGSIVILPPGRASLKLINDSGFTADSLTGLAPGSQPIIVRTGPECEVYREPVVPAPQPLSVSLDGPRLVELGVPANYRATYISPGPVEIEWLPAELWDCPDCPENTLVPTDGQNIAVAVTDGSGCTVVDSIFINVLPGTNALYVPSAFSPNGDGHNDRWEPGFSPQVASIAEWRVYDRWGRLVWEYHGDDILDGRGRRCRPLRVHPGSNPHRRTAKPVERSGGRLTLRECKPGKHYTTDHASPARSTHSGRRPSLHPVFPARSPRRSSS